MLSLGLNLRVTPRPCQGKKIYEDCHFQFQINSEGEREEKTVVINTRELHSGARPKSPLIIKHEEIIFF